MDINALLPLLLGGKGNTDKVNLFSMMTGGKTPDDIMAQSVSPEMSGIVNAIRNNKKTRSNATGLGVIIPFAPAEIIGALVKLLNAV